MNDILQHIVDSNGRCRNRVAAGLSDECTLCPLNGPGEVTCLDKAYQRASISSMFDFLFNDGYTDELYEMALEELTCREIDDMMSKEGAYKE